MKNFKKFSLGIAMLISFLSFGQQKTITGTVSDQTGPLPGANVVVKGTSIGTQTNFDGKYTLKASAGQVLEFSFVGFGTKQVKVAKSNVINVVLEQAVTLNEVVMVSPGYSTKKAVTYSVSQTFHGQSTGVNITCG